MINPKREERGIDMSAIEIFLPKSNKFAFFDDGTIKYFLPEVRAITEIQRLQSSFTESGSAHFFKVYFTYGIDVEFAFENERDARSARHDLICCLKAYWGPDKVIFSNGLACEVTIIPAVQSVTDVFKKDGYALFSITVDSVPQPISLIFKDEIAAISQHEKLLGAVEMHRLQSCDAEARA